MDVATLSHLGRFSGGQTHFYPGFNATSLNDVTKFTRELSRHLSMDISMEAVMRVRCSTGLRATSFFGHFLTDPLIYALFPQCLEISLIFSGYPSKTH